MVQWNLANHLGGTSRDMIPPNSQATLHVSINTTNEDLTCCSTNSQIGHFDDGLVAYYPLDGKTEDESGFANHGMEHGGLDYVQGIYGKAASFDGIDDTNPCTPHSKRRRLEYRPSGIQSCCGFLHGHHYGLYGVWNVLGPRKGLTYPRKGVTSERSLSWIFLKAPRG